MSARPHNMTSAHLDAEKLVTFLIDHDGTSSMTNAAIASTLGISMDRFHRARRHAVSCSTLGGFRVAYRRRGHDVVLVDPDATTILKALVGNRSDPMFAGWHRLRKMYLGTLARMVDIVDGAAKEAESRGDHPLGTAISYAARDIERYGEVQPATVALLASLGVAA